ncbi:MAG: hypothetical protein RLZ81_1656 [Pseudomonadota bacterium]
MILARVAPRLGRWLLWLAALLLAMPGRASPADFQIEHYGVRIEPDFANRAITARATLRIIATAAQASQLALDAGSLQIESVQESDRPVP